MSTKKILLCLTFCLAAAGVYAQTFKSVPYAYKWLNNKEVAFSYQGTFTDDACFKLVMPKGTRVEGVKAPVKYADFPLQPEGAVNLTYSPDSTKLVVRKPEVKDLSDLSISVNLRKFSYPAYRASMSSLLIVGLDS